MTLQVMLNDPSLYQQQKEAFFSSLFFFFFKLAFYECSFYLKKKENKNPEGSQDKVLEKETISKAPGIIGP